jgi:transcriptional regulator with XRE-family HTH domain
MKKTARSYESAILDEFINLENPELTVVLEKIYDAMQLQNISNKTFAESLHVSPSLVTKWLSGQHNFTVDTLVRIEQILDIELINSERIVA